MLEFPTINNRKDKMIYLIIKEIDYENMENTYRVMDFANDIDKANDMLQGYKLIEKQDNVSYSIVKYEKPLVLTEEVA
jgi:hypothetical protein